MQDPIIFVSTLSGSFYAVSKSSGKTLWHLKEGQYYYRQAFPYGRKEGNVLFTTHSTHFIYGYMVSDIWLRTILIVRKESEREMFYLTTHSTHFIYGYMASDMVKDHSVSEKGNPLPPHRLLLSINSKGSFICTIPQTG